MRFGQRNRGRPGGTGYQAPHSQVHRGFLYLDDETVINSLSAVEAGKVDEVVAKINSATEAGVRGGVGIPHVGATIAAGAKSTASLEEEIVRTRTRFSVFEIWLQNLIDRKAIGRFNGWGESVLSGVEPGHTVQFRASLTMAPLALLFRQFLWFAQQAQTEGSMFAQQGTQLEETRNAERVVRALIASDDEKDEQLIVFATPDGEPGPAIAMRLNPSWIIGNLGELAGRYTVVAQVDQVLIQPEQSVPTLRLVWGTPPTPMEIDTLKGIAGPFAETAAVFGLTISEEDASISGPALLLTPIAIFR